MSLEHDDNDPRRRWLVQALTAGTLLSGVGAHNALAQSVLGSLPGPLAPGRSIYRLSGEVTVNGVAAEPSTAIGPGDTLRTGKNSELVFVVGGNAMIMRSSSVLELEGARSAAASLVLTGLRMLTGALLSVSRNQAMRVNTSTATIGIRGTGWYLEADAEQTYFCTCYGVTEVAASADPASKETVAAQHHDRPLYITAGGNSGDNIKPAGFINHSDQELMLIETLVGRTVPFVFPGSNYKAPRRRY